MVHLPTIASISTPPGISGISIVRISGAKSISIVDKIFRPKKKKKLKNVRTHTLHYGHIIDNKTGEIIDEVLVSVMRSPHTYTREDVVEINCHGGKVASQKVLELVIRNGACLSQPGEFTKRAFLHGRLDISQAEAVCDIVYAKTEKQLKYANYQLRGNLSKKIREIKDKLLNIISHLEVVFDYPEEDIQGLKNSDLKNMLDAIIKEIEDIISTYSFGKVLKDGIQMVIVGKPNVGKSTLYNLLVGKERAIVTEFPGTTRDVIEDEISIDGIPLIIKDTAGIRDAKNKVEKIGIDFSKREIEVSDIILFVLDTSRRLSKEDIEIINIIKDKKVIIIFNKIDLPQKFEKKKFLNIAKNVFKEIKIVEISLIRDKIDIIKKEILNIFQDEKVLSSDIIISNMRHKILLEKAVEYLKNALKSLSKNYPQDVIVIDIKDALTEIGKIIGDVTSEDILNNIFEKFCVGK